MSSSPLLQPDRSTLTVVANGQSLSSIRLTTENRDRRRIIVQLPTENFNARGYFIQIQFYLRLTTETCEEVQNPALWVTIHGDSQLVMPLRPSSVTLGLDELSDLFYVPAQAEPDPPTIIVPESPQPDEMEAAGLVSFQLGRWAAATGQTPLVRRGTTPPTNGPSVLIGQGPTFAPQSPWGAVNWDGQRYVTDGGVIPNEHGVLALRQMAYPHLLVSGGTPAAVRTAAEALVVPERRSLLDGDYAILSGAPVEVTQPRPWAAGAASFAQLGLDRRQFVGPGEHQTELAFDRPAGWNLREGGYLELAVEASTAIRPETSWVTLVVNGQEIGTRRLETGSGRIKRYRFDLPVDQLNADANGHPQRRLALSIRFFLDLPQVGCTALSPQSTWAVVLPTSAWFLPHDQAGGIDLARFPAPLAGDGTTRSLTVVLPASPTAGEVEAGLQMMAALGHWTVEPIAAWPRLTTADRIGATEYSRDQLVLIGSPERNSASSDVVLKAPATCRPVQPAVYRLTTGERRAQLCLARSPWTRDSLVLMIFGDEPGLQVGIEALARRSVLGALRGQIATIVDGLPPQTAASGEPTVGQPSSLVPRVEATFTERLQTWQVVGAILLGGFVTAVVFFVSVRWRRKGKA